MAWKDRPYWLRGSIITTLIVFILDIVLFSIFSLAQSVKNVSLGVFAGFALFFLNFFGLFIAVILNIARGGGFLLSLANPNLSNQSTILISIIFSLIFWFLVGAVIGWIVGKIKSKRT